MLRWQGLVIICSQNSGKYCDKYPFQALIFPGERVVISMGKLYFVKSGPHFPRNINLT